jgi:hypothetical protein
MKAVDILLPLFVGPISFCAGWAVGSKFNAPKKRYPIEVHLTSEGSDGYLTMKADSVRGDTVWKDGLWIVNRNIVNVTFK